MTSQSSKPVEPLFTTDWGEDRPVHTFGTYQVVRNGVVQDVLVACRGERVNARMMVAVAYRFPDAGTYWLAEREPFSEDWIRFDDTFAFAQYVGENYH